MTQIEAFIQDNSQAIRELRNLELIRLNHSTPVTNTRNAALRMYSELLENFETTFPRISTTTQLLYWGFIRTRIAGLHLEASDRTRAYEILKAIIAEAKRIEPVNSLLEKLQFPEKCQTLSASGAQLNRSDVLMLNIFAGLFQATFNLLAASLSIETTHYGDEDPAQSDTSALHWLHSAKRLHELYLKQNLDHVGPTFWETIQFRECVESLGDSLKTASSQSEISAERLLFEHGYTTTIFLLAQAYQLADERDHAAACCQLTLSRQMTFARPFHDLLRVFGPLDHRKRARPASARRTRDAATVSARLRRRQIDFLSAAFQPFDRTEWAANAAALGRYYETVEQQNDTFYSALECYVSACAILDEIGPQPLIPSAVGNKAKPPSTREQRVRADVYRSLSDLAIRLLELGAQRIQSNTSPRGQSVSWKDQRTSEAAKDFGSMFQLDLRPVLEHLTEHTIEEPTESSAVSEEMPKQTSKGDPSMSVGQVCPSDEPHIVDALASVPTTFTGASYLFRLIMHAITQTEQFYTMEDRCSDAVHLVQNRSKAYRLLTVFEPNKARQCRMHKRRVDMLTRVLKPLSRQHYQQLCRQLLFELAETLSTLRDLKQEMHDELTNEASKALVHYARKANQLAKRALSVFEEFLMTFVRSPSQNAKPRELSEDEIRPVLLAHFYSARLHSRLITVNPNEQIRNLSRSLAEYRYVVSTAEQHLLRYPHSVIKNTEEVSIARDMCDLLPVRLTRLTHGEPIETTN